jgi:hypothetical protein
MWSHSKNFYGSWIFNSFLEICKKVKKEKKKKKEHKPKAIVLLYCYTCHSANIYIFPLDEIKMPNFHDYEMITE